MVMVLGKKENRARTLNIGALSFVLLFLLSCTAATNNSQQQQSSHLQAENSMMKKRLPLMERESDVLKKENEQLRGKLQDSAAQNKQLAMDLATLREQYKSDMIVGEEQIRSLEDTLQKIEQENRATLDILLADNKVLQKKMDKQSRTYTDQLAMQKTASAQQLEKLIKENGQKEAELTTKLTKADALAAELAKAREASQAELTSIKAAGLKARGEYLAQMESIKTTNTELNKKIAELSRDLSRQQHPELSLQ